MSGDQPRRPRGWPAPLGLAALLALPALLLLDDTNWFLVALYGTLFGLPLGVASVLLYLTSAGAATAMLSAALWRFMTSGNSRRSRLFDSPGVRARLRGAAILGVGLLVTVHLFPALPPAGRPPICSAREVSVAGIAAAYALAGMAHGNIRTGIGSGGSAERAKCRSAARPSIGFVLPTWFALVLVLALAARTDRVRPAPPAPLRFPESGSPGPVASPKHIPGPERSGAATVVTSW
jgi:hypothetical protein